MVLHFFLTTIFFFNFTKVKYWFVVIGIDVTESFVFIKYDEKKIKWSYINMNLLT